MVKPSFETFPWGPGSIPDPKDSPGHCLRSIFFHDDLNPGAIVLRRGVRVSRLVPVFFLTGKYLKIGFDQQGGSLNPDGDKTGQTATTPPETEARGRKLAGLTLAALGIVFGDIGTSPLYAIRECFHGDYGIAPTPENILGVLSLIFWSLTIVVSIKYLTFILKAENQGEGDVIALVALVRPTVWEPGPGKWLLVGCGLFGASLLYGDGMITPAISVLSAVEGLQVITPIFQPYIVPVTVVLLATLATIIASQAVISGAFSLTRQAIQLGYLPRLNIIHTSNETIGQIYVPQVNALLMVATISLVLGFGSSSKLAAAYGVAVTTTMVIATLLFYVIARERWMWSRWAAGVPVAIFLLVDLSFFAANISKILHGAWFPLVIAALIFALMITWARGRSLLFAKLQADTLTLEDFFQSIADSPPPARARKGGLSHRQSRRHAPVAGPQPQTQ